MIQIKRIYDPPAIEDGFRVLVDRLWPRGVSKERAALDKWLKEIAPSPELRIWFGHEPAKFKEFAKRYNTELSHNPATAEVMQLVKQHKTLTLLYAARNPAVNHALILQKFLQSATKH
jgi:uncharacterized protein YeaO (DUF488 family)